MIHMICTRHDSYTSLKEKTLLILTPSYPNENESFIVDTFVKYQVDELKKYFNNIVVIAPVLRSFGYFRKDRLCKDYSYDNVNVYFPRCFYIPISWSRKILVDNRLRIVEQTIEEHHLEFDLIHAHFTWPSGYLGVQLKEKYETPVITTIHENGNWFDQEVKMNNHFINETWAGADALIRVNQKDIPILKRYNEQVYFIPNGFSSTLHPTCVVAARELLGVPADIKIIFALGNLVKRKGFNYLIDAMKLICSQRDDVLCYIGGKGPEKGRLQRQIDRLHLGKNVKLLGSIPCDQLNFWMNACDLFVLPSLSESFGIVQIEALACGKPVVSARNRGSEEVIVLDDYGLLVEPADPSDLCVKILLALSREWDSEMIIAYAEQFAWSSIAKEIVKKHEQLLVRDTSGIP